MAKPGRSLDYAVVLLALQALGKAQQNEVEYIFHISSSLANRVAFVSSIFSTKSL